jgi:RNA polymerase sigma factor (sigma-70 family)
MNQQSTWKELLDGCALGQRAAQMETYRRVWRDIYPAVWRIVRDKAQAEDIMQESIIKGFELIHTLQTPEAYPAWQRRLAVNDALMWWRKRAQPLQFIEVHTDHATSEEEVEIEYDWSHVERELANLPDGYRMVIQLHALEQMKHEEIALLLNISASTVRSQYSRGLSLLRSQLNEKQVGTYH